MSRRRFNILGWLTSPIKEIELNVNAIKNGPKTTKHSVIKFLTMRLFRIVDIFNINIVRILCCKIDTVSQAHSHMLYSYTIFLPRDMLISSSFSFFRNVFRLIPNKSEVFSWFPRVAARDRAISGSSISFITRS